MKSYKSSEALGMLEENPKLKFVCGGYELYTAAGEVIIRDIENNSYDCGFCLDDEWDLVQQKVPFMEAAEAFKNGKNVRCEYKGTIDGYRHTRLFKQGSKKGVMLPDNDLTFYLVTDGKWFIEETEEE